jgi:hypothetical protein
MIAGIEAPAHLQGLQVKGLGFSGPAQVVAQGGEVVERLGHFGVIAFEDAPVHVEALLEERLGLCGVSKVAARVGEVRQGLRDIGVISGVQATLDVEGPLQERYGLGGVSGIEQCPRGWRGVATSKLSGPDRRSDLQSFPEEGLGLGALHMSVSAWRLRALGDIAVAGRNNRGASPAPPEEHSARHVVPQSLGRSRRC